ncbi:MAG: hypothetical protein R6U57_13130, partial [Anaerolineales bacterium]
RVNAPHLVALVKAGVEFPNGKAEMFQPEPAHESVPSGEEDIFSETPSIFVTKEMSIHNI